MYNRKRDIGAQGRPILEGVFKNVAAGVFGRWVRAVAKEEEDASRAALMHEFMRNLLNGYDTLLGGGAGGVGLSSGQKQRLAFARAQLKNLSFEILGMNFLFCQLFLSYQSISSQTRRLPRWTLPRPHSHSKLSSGGVKTTPPLLSHDLPSATSCILSRCDKWLSRDTDLTWRLIIKKGAWVNSGR